MFKTVEFPTFMKVEVAYWKAEECIKFALVAPCVLCELVPRMYIIVFVLLLRFEILSLAMICDSVDGIRNALSF